MATLTGAISMLDGTAGSLAKMSDRIHEAGVKFDKMSQSAFRASGTVGTLWKKVLDNIDLGKIMDMSDEYGRMKAKLDVMNDGMQNTAALQTMVYGAAQRSGQEYNRMVGFAAQLSSATGDAFSSNTEAVGFAEQIGKHLQIAGADASGAGKAMEQLGEALADGTLDGRELQFVMQTMPTAATALGKSLNLSSGELMAMADQGGISAEKLKTALGEAAAETEARFQALPMSFETAFTQMGNAAKQSLNPVWEALGSVTSQFDLKGLLDEVTPVMGTIAQVIAGTIYNIGGAFRWLSEVYENNSRLIKTLVIPLLGAVAVNLGIAALSAMSAAIGMMIKGAADIFATGAIIALELAQYGFNAALALCPITWIVGGVLLLLAAIYYLIDSFVEAKNEGVSAFGTIVGAIYGFFAMLVNNLVMTVNVVASVLEDIINNANAFVNLFVNLFTNPFAAIQKFVLDIAGNVLGVLEAIAQGIDKIFGTNMSGAITNLRSNIAEAKKELEKDSGVKDYFIPIKLGRLSYLDQDAAFQKGYEHGASLDGGISFQMPGVGTLPSAGVLPSTAVPGSSVNTGEELTSIRSAMEASGEDLKIMRGLAEQEASGPPRIAEIKVDMSGMQNHISKEVDIDAVITRLNFNLAQCLAAQAEGVHRA